MKSFLAALAVTVALATVSMPASAGYVSPSSSWQTKALSNGY